MGLEIFVFATPAPSYFQWPFRNALRCGAKIMATTTDRLVPLQSGTSAGTSAGISAGSSAGTWRTPFLIIGFGCLISLLSFGPRSSLGFFLTPMSTDNHWGRDVFAFALALQNLLWGIGQPLAGIIADRFGTIRVLCAGALLYAAGLALMSHATSVPLLDVSAGVLVGFGLAGCSFPVVLAALG